MHRNARLALVPLALLPLILTGCGGGSNGSHGPSNSGTPTPAPAYVAPLNYAYARTIGVTGTSGSDATHLYEPYNITTDAAGNLYVADDGNSRVQKFAPGSTTGTTVAGDPGGTSGSDATHLNAPEGVAVDSSGTLYVADYNNGRVQKFAPGSTTGTTVAAAGLSNPVDVALDSTGNLYVLDYTNDQVVRFPPNSTSATTGTVVAGGNGAGSAANQLHNPYGLCVDAAGDIYVADYSNARVQKFPAGSTSSTNGVTVAGTGTAGTGATQLYNPAAVALDSGGYLYVGDYEDSRVQRFAPNSTSSATGVTVAGDPDGTYGSDNAHLDGATGVAIGPDGTMYVADYDNDRVQVFN